MTEFPSIVIDNGTGYTKMGYGGNRTPQFVIPTVISTKSNVQQNNVFGGDDLDFLIGNEAASLMGRSQAHSLEYPIKHGQVEDWDLMESYWQHCFYRYLRCDPSQHSLLLTEPPLNLPENREYTAEIMFESFGVPNLYIAVQAVLALAASWMSINTSISDNPLTGCVVDSGDGVTHIIPVVEGYAISSAIKHVPLAGREVTLMMQQLLRDRPDLKGVIPPDDSLDIARRIKESCCYVSPDLPKEFAKFDLNPASNMNKLDINNGRVIEVGPERFLAPEVFFNPEMLSTNFNSTHTSTNNNSKCQGIVELVDSVIQTCPIDSRRSLYRNIVLSGGSTMFNNFDRRLQRDLREVVEARLSYTQSLDAVNKGSIPQVQVIAHENQRFAVWCGGSMFASMPQFNSFCISKQDYDEYGASIARKSKVFTTLLS